MEPLGWVETRDPRTSIPRRGSHSNQLVRKVSIAFASCDVPFSKFKFVDNHPKSICHSPPLHAIGASSESKPRSDISLAESEESNLPKEATMPKHKKKRCWKERKERHRMVIDANVDIGKISNLLGRATIG